jgi:hypothetical protein
MKHYLYFFILILAISANAQKVGVNNTNPQAALDINGDLRLRSVTLSSVTAGLNLNVDINAPAVKSSVYMLNPSLLGTQIGGFNGGVDGRMMTIFNNTAGAVQLYNEFVSTVDVNRILTGTGNTAIIYGNGSATLRYDGAKMRWTIVSSNYTDGLSAAAPTSNGNAGFGFWGDCSTNNISEYNPVVDDTSGNNDQFGNSIAISGNYAIVGAYREKVGANSNQGSVSIYQLTAGNWVLMQKITDATGEANDFFGYSVAISGNYAIVGAAFDDVGSNINQGSVSIYQLIGGNWVLMQKITDATGVAGDNFGYNVAISGNYAIVGAINDDVGSNINQGSVNIYQLTGGNWVIMQQITDATGTAYNFFGNSVAISGNYAIVGASYDVVGGNNEQGSVSFYQLINGNWVLMQKITDATGAANDFFGSSVAISGNYAIVGAKYDDVGSNSNQGSISIYQLTAGNWVLMQKITDATGAASDYFGNSVAISGNYAIVGASDDDVGSNSNQGSGSIYQRIGKVWQKVQYVTDPRGNLNDFFGSSVSIDDANKRFLIGVPGYGSSSGKVVFGKLNF